MRHHKQPQCLPPNGEAVEESLKLLTCLRYLAKIKEKLSEINSDFVGFILSILHFVSQNRLGLNIG